MCIFVVVLHAYTLNETYCSSELTTANREILLKFIRKEFNHGVRRKSNVNVIRSKLYWIGTLLVRTIGENNIYYCYWLVFLEWRQLQRVQIQKYLGNIAYSILDYTKYSTVGLVYWLGAQDTFVIVIYLNSFFLTAFG